MPMNRFRSTSTDSGETWAPLGFDKVLSDKGHGCQGSMLSQRNKPSDTLFFSRPWTASRANMTVWISEDGGHSWPRTIQVWPGTAAYSSLSNMPDEDSRASSVYDDRVGLLFERGGPACTAGSASCQIDFAVIVVSDDVVQRYGV
jgi:sialidase-1